MRLVRSKGFALAIIVIVLAVVTYNVNENFISRINLRGTIFVPMVLPGIMLVAVGPLLMGGGIDLSCAAQAAMASVIFAKILESNPGLPWPVVLIITLICGVGFGLVNVFFTNVLNFMPFIATIGMSSVYLGIAQWWTLMNNVPINVTAFNDLGGTAFFGDYVPLFFIFMLILVAVYTYILSNTRFGRSIYMVGGNQVAARLAGLEPKRVRAALFINSGVISALAGVVWASQLKMGHAQNLVNGMPNFAALTALILGGVSFMGGTGGLISGVIALMMVTLFDNTLTIIAQTFSSGGVPLYGVYVNTILKGLILVVALMLDHVGAVRQRRALTAAAMKSHEEAAADAA